MSLEFASSAKLWDRSWNMRAGLFPIPFRRLVVVGEMPIDENTKQYVAELRRRYSMPLSYRHVSLAAAQKYRDPVDVYRLFELPRLSAPSQNSETPVAGR